MERGHAGVPEWLPILAGVCACLIWMGPEVRAVGNAGSPAERIIDALARVSQRPSVSYTAHRRLTAKLLDSREQAWMEVLTQFDPRSGMTYSILSEGGSDRLRRRALYTVLGREVAASRRNDPSQSAFSPSNYQFGVVQPASDIVRVVMTPLRRDARLIDGIATVHPRTATLVQVDGRLAKDPSFWVKDVRIALRYASLARTTLPVQLSTLARVRLFGTASLDIEVRYLTVDGHHVESPPASLAMPGVANLFVAPGE